MNDTKKEVITFIFKFVLSGAELANPFSWCSETFTPTGREIKNKSSDPESLALIGFCLFFLFGVRASELSALKKANVDLKNMLLHVKGVYIPSEGGYLNQTKNRGSRRSIPIQAHAAKFLTEWLEYLEENYKYSIYS